MSGISSLKMDIKRDRSRVKGDVSIESSLKMPNQILVEVDIEIEISPIHSREKY